MVKIKVKVPHGHTEHGELDAYVRIIHQHLRYAGIVNIPEFYDSEHKKPIEFVIDVDFPWSESVITRIKSFRDSAEIIED